MKDNPLIRQGEAPHYAYFYDIRVKRKRFEMSHYAAI
ncbi:hypothetical protein J2W22_001934 [Sphingomonas kyeonggiensis]|nr:hypothetical protein [Sphingomonas kyeonggiensis]